MPHLGCQQFRGNRLALLHHHSDGSLPHAASHEREYPYHDHDQHRRAKYGQKHDRHDWDRHELAHLSEIGIIIFIACIDSDSVVAAKFLLQLLVNSVGQIR